MARPTHPREVLEGGQLKGGIFRSHLNWVNEKHAQKTGEVWSRMPPDAAKRLSTVVLASSWYPFAWLIHLDRAIADAFGGGTMDAVRELGQYSARINLSTTYKVLDRDTNHDFFRNSAVLHSQFQDFGKVSYVEKSNGGVMVHTGYPCFSTVFCASAIGYYEQTILSHGGRNVRVREVECQCFGETSCSFEMEWA